MLTILFGGATALSLVMAAAAHRWLYRGERDRLLLAGWMMSFWVLEEVLGRTQDWPFVWSISPAFDFAAGALMLVSWLQRPNWWRMAVWLIFWAMCVAHLAYRLDFSPQDFASERYRILMNALYGMLLLVTSGSVVWDAILAVRDRRPLFHRLPAGHRSGLEGSK